MIKSLQIMVLITAFMMPNSSFAVYDDLDLRSARRVSSGGPSRGLHISAATAGLIAAIGGSTIRDQEARKAFLISFAVLVFALEISAIATDSR